IGKFAILSLESKGSGIYRIEGATGKKIKEALKQSLSGVIQEISELKKRIQILLEEARVEGVRLDYKEVKSSLEEESYRYVLKLREEVSLLQETVKDLDKKVAKAKKENNQIALEDYLENNLTIKDYNVLINKTLNLETEVLKDLVDRLADKLESSLIFFANISEGKLVFVCKNKIAKLHAGMLVKAAAELTLGNGGGRADFAQAGGKDVLKVDLALQEVLKQIESKL
ncbi:MAG: DHHA1 domain-containing protein, partial [Bacilli bacterium]|nr:DHHA1 domain-containing protein [Bacilli bacterium]